MYLQILCHRQISTSSLLLTHQCSSMRILLAAVSVILAMSAQTCSCQPGNRISISVTQNGADVSRCVTGTTPCRSLDYVLRALSNNSWPCLAPSDVIVNIQSNADIVPDTYTFVCDLNLRIRRSQFKGSLVPNATCLNDGGLTFVSASNASISLQWESTNVVNCSGPHAIGLRSLRFSACQLLFSKGMYVRDTIYVQIMESQFEFSHAYSKDARFLITNEAMTQLVIKNSAFLAALSPTTTATTLWIVRSVLRIEGKVTFMDGFGQFGGAIRMTHSQVVTVGNTTVLFAGNRAQYGSAVYVDDIVCPLLDTSIGYPSFFFQNNTVNAGQSVVYIDGNPDNCAAAVNLSYNVTSDNGNNFLKTAATNLYADLPANFGVFPGKDIILNSTIMDYFQNAAICLAKTSMTLTYYGELLNISCNDPRYEVELVCPFASLSQSSILLSTSSSTNTTLQVRTATDPAVSQNDWNITITFVCDNGPGPQASITFTVQKCPPFVTYYNDLTHSCECVTPVTGGAHLICSASYGAFCIENGHWVGTEKDVFGVLPCDQPYCFPQSHFCPVNGKPSFSLLSQYPDDQCSTSHGGLLCRACKDGYFFTHYPLQCVSGCPVGSSVGILVTSIVIHILKSLAAIWVVSFATKSGNLYRLSYLYSSLVYLHVLGIFPLAYMPQYKVLRVLISITRSISLPVLDIFGEIPVCFFPSIGPLGIFAFNYIGPAVELVLLCIASWCTIFCQNHFKPLLPESIGILLFWPMWTISSTSITILKYTDLGSFGSLRVMLQPEVEYLSGAHLPLFIIAVLLLSLLVFPCCVVFVVSLLPFKGNVLKTSLFHGLQSSYKDKQEWFSTVYFIFWLVIVSVAETHSKFLLICLMLLVSLCGVHYLLWPYRDELLNRIDMATLLNLLVTSSLIQQQTLQTKRGAFITSCVYIFISSQLLCTGVLTGSLLTTAFRHFASCNKAFTVPSVLHNKYDTLGRNHTPVQTVLIDTAALRDEFEASYTNQV